MRPQDLFISEEIQLHIERRKDLIMRREPTYDIHKHRHIFSAWAAGRASSVALFCRFPVKSAFEIIEHVGLQDINLADELPSPDKLKISHRKWRQKAKDYAKTMESSLFHSEVHAKNFTDGIAAKLINIYLKSKFISGPDVRHENIAALHPPVDRLLLNELARKDVKRAKDWKRYRDKGWSSFSSNDYEEVMGLITDHQNGSPLWQIERYWPGHQ